MQDRQPEERGHLYVAGLTPVKPRVGEKNLHAADEQRQKGERGDPMGDTNQR